MDYVSSIFLAILLFLLGAVSPGPNFVVVAQRSMAKGRCAGIVTGLGVATGDALYAGAGIFGLSTIIATSGTLFTWVRLLGGLYIGYLGFGMILSKRSPSREFAQNQTDGLRDCYLRGLITDLSNPKTIVFFASIFASTYRVGQPFWVSLAMVLGIVIASLGWRIGLSFVFSTGGVKQLYRRFQTHVERTFGVMLLLMGGKLSWDGVAGRFVTS